MANKYFLRMGNDYLHEAVPYSSKRGAVDAYEKEAAELYRFGQSIEATIHIATSEDDLAEYPDYVLTYNGRRVKVTAA